MALLILIVQILALLLVTPLDQYDMRAFDNPESIWNPIFYILLILVFTGVLLLIIKYQVKWLIQGFIAFAVFSTLVYVLFGLSVLAMPDILPEYALLGSLGGSLLFTVLMFFYPEWFIIDIVGILIAAGASAIFGISLAVIPTILLLVILAVYDFISVYKTKHMITLAEGVMDLKLPILFVLPRKLNYSFARSRRKSIEQGSEREAYFMGLGDAVIPSILAVSANAFISAPGIGFINFPALGTIAGTLISYIGLMYLVLKGKPQAGLPFLCTGAIVGFLIGCAVAGVNPFF
ncbi:hypothetical protein CUJ83_10260 [Methanocella sp. CWC-04]|uniref:Signal-peptide peptidase, presenilin aspartyl protease n=2 Tax=Methanooceanicella nereidis TaxID=2052831 RepID=A0AAP2RD55_9EURY|nr:hypothetical protein [Methanocella sp. CWC-04]